jgi:hypothetical protein
MECLPSGKVLINSERHSWIVTSSKEKRNYQVPHGFFCYTGEFIPRKHRIYSDGTVEIDGLLADWKIRSSILELFVAKITSHYQALGELITCVGHICAGEPLSPLRRTGFLFVFTQFWIVTFNGKHPIKITKAEYTTPGTKDLVQDHLKSKNPWAAQVERVCKNLRGKYFSLRETSLSWLRNIWSRVLG